MKGVEPGAAAARSPFARSRPPRALGKIDLQLGRGRMRHRRVTVELSARDRALILRDGYPFLNLKKALTALAGDESVRRVVIDPFELEQLIGDLSHSTNRCADHRLRLELTDLCERLEDDERRWRAAI
ncbi:MAG: hypothetical protein ACREIU_12120 [Planctomycetota bacterium]